MSTDPRLVLEQAYGAAEIPNPGDVPGPGPDSGEDEGWVLTYVYDAGRDKSDFVVLDGRDPAGPPVATVRLPQRVPFGFHGSWIPATALA